MMDSFRAQTIRDIVNPPRVCRSCAYEQGQSVPSFASDAPCRRHRLRLVPAGNHWYKMGRDGQWRRVIIRQGVTA